MIYLNKGKIDNIYLTLNENQTISSPNYLFVFVNRSSNCKVKMVLKNEDDISLYKVRFNKFTIDTDTYFKKWLSGQYIYSVYEIEGEEIIDESGLNLLETGIMNLVDSPIEYKQYTTTNTFKIRQ